MRPVVREPRLSDKVAEMLLDTITVRSLKPGERLPSERKLGEQVSVSHTVIREAVRALAAKGVIEARTGSGLRAAAVEASAVSESMGLFLRGARLDYTKIHEVRTTLEVEVAGLAAERATDEDIAGLQENLERTKAGVKDIDAVAVLDGRVPPPYRRGIPQRALSGHDRFDRGDPARDPAADPRDPPDGPRRRSRRIARSSGRSRHTHRRGPPRDARASRRVAVGLVAPSAGRRHVIGAGRLDHVAILVGDSDKALGYFRDELGASGGTRGSRREDRRAVDLSRRRQRVHSTRRAARSGECACGSATGAWRRSAPHLLRRRRCARHGRGACGGEAVTPGTGRGRLSAFVPGARHGVLVELTESGSGYLSYSIPFVRQAVFKAPLLLEIERRQLRSAAAGEALLAVRSVGVSGPTSMVSRASTAAKPRAWSWATRRSRS